MQGDEMPAPAFVDPIKSRDFAKQGLYLSRHNEASRNNRVRKQGNADDEQSDPPKLPLEESVAPQTPPSLKPLTISTPSPARPSALSATVRSRNLSNVVGILFPIMLHYVE